MIPMLYLCLTSLQYMHTLHIYRYNHTLYIVVRLNLTKTMIVHSPTQVGQKCEQNNEWILKMVNKLFRFLTRKCRLALGLKQLMDIYVISTYIASHIDKKQTTFSDIFDNKLRTSISADQYNVSSADRNIPNSPSMIHHGGANMDTVTGSAFSSHRHRPPENSVHSQEDT